MEEQQSEFMVRLDEKIATCKQRGRQLREEGRTDEGIFENIRINVYEIFKTVFTAAEKTCGADPAAKRDFFLQKTEKIPENWKISYDKAKAHGDTEKMHIEHIKLKAAQEIRDMIAQMWK